MLTTIEFKLRTPEFKKFIVDYETFAYRNIGEPFSIVQHPDIIKLPEQYKLICKETNAFNNLILEWHNQFSQDNTFHLTNFKIVEDPISFTFKLFIEIDYEPKTLSLIYTERVNNLFGI